MHFHCKCQENQAGLPSPVSTFRKVNVMCTADGELSKIVLPLEQVFVFRWILANMARFLLWNLTQTSLNIHVWVSAHPPPLGTYSNLNTQAFSSVKRSIWFWCTIQLQSHSFLGLIKWPIPFFFLFFFALGFIATK